MRKIGICFSKKFQGTSPLIHVGGKLPVYIRFLKLCQNQNWQVFILTRREYQGKGIFAKSWLFEKNKFRQFREPIKIDLVYDRTGGLNFPSKKDSGVIYVNQRNFKVLCWDKYRAYKYLSNKKIGYFMPQTFRVDNKFNLKLTPEVLKGEKVVLKPNNGFGGAGIFIGKKKDALGFKFPKKYKNYSIQEFIDTSCGIPKLVKGVHDLRTVIVNNKIVWSHIRTPSDNELITNLAQGGKIKGIDVSRIPQSIKGIVKKISKLFFEEFDNPVFSLDFGMTKNGPKIFEINDQIGFPGWQMKARDKFLNELIKNFKIKLRNKSN
jgi:glutathione synthase/RimK-type ligase-like ATP-grasp enzyme